MSLGPDEKRRFLKALEEDEEFRLAVMGGLLGITDIQSLLKELVNVVNTLVGAIRGLIDGQGKLLEIAKQLLEGQNKLWEEVRALREENHRLWEENKRINENIERLWQENKRINENIERLWQENNKIWQELRWLRNALLEIRDALGGGFEYYTARVVKAILRERGINCDIIVNATLPIDGYREVDIFCPEPLVIGEVTVTLRSTEEANNQLDKLNASVTAAEKFTGRKTYLKVLAVETVPNEVSQYLVNKAREQGIYLIIGREYENK